MLERTSIYTAIADGDWRSVSALATQRPDELRTQNGRTPLLEIAGTKPDPKHADAYMRAVDALVAAGVDLNARDEGNRTALQIAAEHSPHAFVRITKALDDQERARAPTTETAFTRRDIHSALLTADATLASGSRDEIPVLRLLDAERDAARRELSGKVTRAEAELHAELIAHRLMDHVKENPIAAATVGEQLRAHGLLNSRANSAENDEREAHTVALVSAYKATQFTEKSVADRLASQAVESLKTMASMGRTIDQTAKAEPDRLQAILGNARGHVAQLIEQHSQRGRTEELAR
jgi:hypothetical protein